MPNNSAAQGDLFSVPTPDTRGLMAIDVHDYRPPTRRNRPGQSYANPCSGGLSQRTEQSQALPSYEDGKPRDSEMARMLGPGSIVLYAPGALGGPMAKPVLSAYFESGPSYV